MKKKIFIPINVLIIVISILFFFVRCNSDESAWNLTQESDSVEKYQEFLNKYPNSKYSEQAKQFIDLNLPSEYKSAIDLMLTFWFNSIKPVEREGIKWYGTSSLMFSAVRIKITGRIKSDSTLNSESDIVVREPIPAIFHNTKKLDSTLYSKRIINKLNKYIDVECNIEAENIYYDYNGTQTIIDSQSDYSCKLDGKLKYDIIVVNGEFGIQEDKDFYIKDSTIITINNTTYEYLNKHWKKK